MQSLQGLRLLAEEGRTLKSPSAVTPLLRVLLASLPEPQLLSSVHVKLSLSARTTKCHFEVQLHRCAGGCMQVLMQRLAGTDCYTETFIAVQAHVYCTVQDLTSSRIT